MSLRLVLFGLLLFPVSGIAAYSNYNSMLIGAEASGRGGAYTAVVGDSSAAAFYNPATLSRIQSDSVSATATVYNKFDTTYGESEGVLDATERINRGFFRTVPSSLGAILLNDGWFMSLSIVVPDYNYFSGSVIATPTTQTFLTNSDESLWSGFSFARNFGPHHSFGFSVYYTARALVRSMTDRFVVDVTREILTYEEKTVKTNNLVAVLGYLWDSQNKWRWGVSLRPPALRLTGRGSLYRSTTDTSSLPSEVVFFQNIQAKNYIPPKLAIGTSWDATPKLNLSLDASVYGAHGYKDMSQDDASDLIEHVVTWNAALGFEYSMDWPRILLRGGIFTNNSSHDEPPETNFYRRGDATDLIGLSGNIGFKTNDNVQYTIGGFYTGGEGRSVQRSGNSFVNVRKSHHLFSLLIGTSYSF